MPGTQVGFFLVPAEHLAEMHEIFHHADRASLEMHHDWQYRLYRLFGRAQELAVASAVLDLPDEPKAIYPFIEVCYWVKECFADDKRHRRVFDPDEVTTVQAYMERQGFAGLATYARAHKRRSGGVAEDVLRPYYDALLGLLRSAPAGGLGLGLVTAAFDPEHRDPPPPPPPPPPPRLEPLTPEEEADAEKSAAYFARIVRNQRRRYWFSWWPELTSEGRVLLGCLPAEDGPEWRDMYEDAWATEGAVAGTAALRRFSDAIEPALEHGLIDGSAGMVYAIEQMRDKVCWREPAFETVVYTPDEVRELRQRLDLVLAEHGGEPGFLRWLKKQARHWKMAIPRAALAAVREHLDRAIATESWLLWLHDIHDWPGER
jgi:hypothetical protein